MILQWKKPGLQILTRRRSTRFFSAFMEDPTLKRSVLFFYERILFTCTRNHVPVGKIAKKQSEGVFVNSALKIQSAFSAIFPTVVERLRSADEKCSFIVIPCKKNYLLIILLQSWFHIHVNWSLALL